MLDIIHAFISPSVLSFLIPFSPFIHRPSPKTQVTAWITQLCFWKPLIFPLSYNPTPQHLPLFIFFLSFILVLLCSPIRELHDRWWTPLLCRCTDPVRLCSDRDWKGSYHLKSRERGGGGMATGGGLKVRKLLVCVRASIRFNWAGSLSHTHTHTHTWLLRKHFVEIGSGYAAEWMNCVVLYAHQSLSHTHRLYVWIVLVHHWYKRLYLPLFVGIWWHICMKSGKTR